MIVAPTLVNASIGFRAAKGWDVALFARNLFNRNYLQNLTVQAGNSGLVVGTPATRACSALH
jgi:iron complex outermembrane receptor protein